MIHAISEREVRGCNLRIKEYELSAEAINRRKIITSAKKFSGRRRRVVLSGLENDECRDGLKSLDVLADSED